MKKIEQILILLTCLLIMATAAIQHDGKVWGHDLRAYAKDTAATTAVADTMRSLSGRDGDKGKALGLHLAYTPHGAPYYKEATEVYECEIMYAHQFSRDGFRNDVPKKLYEDFPPRHPLDVHRRGGWSMEEITH